MSHLPDEIRQALEKPDGISEETMQPLAERFDDAVRAVNERLNEAVALLRKNLRSEAIQAANRRPNAMEAAASLDFPELPEWEEILQFLGIAVPQRLDQDKVQQLNEAIVEGQPIEELLKQHRRLAIAKAPLSWRLKILRRIAEVDEMNPIWIEDIENYEAARRKTLTDEVEAAIKSSNQPAIERLYAELTKATWCTPLPNKLIDSLRQAISSRKTEDQLKALKYTAERFHAAFSEFNESSARTLSAQWQNQCQQFGKSIPADLLEETEPALTWLAELDSYAAIAKQRDKALVELESSLDARRDLPSLHKAFTKASTFDEPVPQALEQRFRTSVHEIQLAGKRKTQLRISSIIAATVLVAAAVAFWQYRLVQEQRLAQAVTQFSSLVQNKKTDESSAFWDRLKTQDPDLTRNPKLISLYGQLENQLKQESDRKQEFDSYLEQAKNEDPAKIDQEALKKAENLAVSENERSRVFEIQQQLDQYARMIADEQTAAALDAIAKIRDKIDALEKTPLEDLDLGSINTLIVTLENIPPLYPNRLRSVDGQLKITKSRATSLETSINNERARKAKLEAAKRPLFSARTLTAFESGLKRYSQAVATTKTGQEYEQSYRENSLWRKGMRSNELPQLLRRSLVSGLTKPEIATLLELQQTIESEIALNPLLDDYKAVTSTVLRDTGDPLSELEKLKNAISRLPLEQLVTIETKSTSGDGKLVRYFAYNRDYQRVAKQLEKEAKIGMRHIADSDGSVSTTTITGPAARIHVEPGRTITWLLDTLDAKQDAIERNWGSELLRLCGDISQRRDLDALIKEDLIYLLLQACANGSSMMQEKIAAPITALRVREGIRQQWAIPKPPDDKLVTSVLRDVLTPLALTFKELANDSPDLKQVAMLEYRWIGFLTRDYDGEILGSVPLSLKESGPVYIMRTAAENPSKLDIITVGKLEAGTLVLDQNSRELNAGRPLFFLSQTN
ncbi:hypothetical protein OAG34_01360 [bacterium]|nr:hypothetical protein [bacterium]